MKCWYDCASIWENSPSSWPWTMAHIMKLCISINDTPPFLSIMLKCWGHLGFIDSHSLQNIHVFGAKSYVFASKTNNNCGIWLTIIHENGKMVQTSLKQSIRTNKPMVFSGFSVMCPWFLFTPHSHRSPAKGTDPFGPILKDFSVLGSRKYQRHKNTM
jgi:hypothetical protein